LAVASTPSLPEVRQRQRDAEPVERRLADVRPWPATPVLTLFRMSEIRTPRREEAPGRSPGRRRMTRGPALGVHNGRRRADCADYCHLCMLAALIVRRSPQSDDFFTLYTR
jgi:hypothetical protein